MKLELMVSKTVAWAHTVEHALHGRGPWSFRTTAGVCPAHRIIDCERAEVIFTGMVIWPQCGVYELVELWNGDELVTMTHADSTRGEKLTWRVSLMEAAPAS